MKPATKTALLTLFSLVLAIVLVWLSMRSINLSESAETLKNANYFYVILSILLGGSAYWFRSQRWRLLLEPLGYRVSASNAFYSVCINYLMNLGIPRSGEPARSGALYKAELVPFNKSFGTVVSERLIDMICLLLVMSFTLIINYDIVVRLVQQALGQSERDYSVKNLIIPALIGLLAVGLFIFIFVKVIQPHIKNFRIYRKMRLFLYGLRKGLQTIFRLKRKREFLLYTLFIWLFYYLMTYIVVFALPFSSHLDWKIGFFLLIAGGVGMVIPASGGVGSFHKAMQLAFITLGLNAQQGFDFALLIHTPQTLVAIVLGVISFILLPNRLK